MDRTCVSDGLFEAAAIRGIAHSFECWLPDEQGEMQLAGGFYGVQIGCVFYGESMFALRPDASKIAFACAVPFLADLGKVTLIDCQQDTDICAVSVRS